MGPFMYKDDEWVFKTLIGFAAVGVVATVCVVGYGIFRVFLS